ncbi:hypothetical protein OEIGOIKO_00505 [Streptomyces chrestomyceticus JCM 4735]|uniref:Integral membrane protein n=1 Tax=Streptomyces chrestomyceticus JCM 4735 TaxID=1306181 RepID=A0A7U9KQ95_9ACTN|nr:hypothetical protein [Streptomyces chrestomyceticus]GCD32788.1 hypothetical protein OEIGOIKO_00505 [Streptomyces chrestomyceticus JCM 4735]
MATPLSRPPSPFREPLPRSGRPRPVPWLALVAVAYALVQLAFVVPHTHTGLGWDETVYVSQSDPRTPAAYFSAPRSRGISFLVAPVLAVSSSVPLLRTVLALASAVALYGAFRVWESLLGHRTAALAALLFAGLWASMLNGSQVMPNLWVALCAAAAVGWFLRIPTDPRARWWLAGALCLATLLRLPDSGWLSLPLLLTAVCVQAYRPAVPALLGGLALGSAQWVAEAYVRFGGIGERLHIADATEGGMAAGHGFGAGAAAALHSLNGPLLCRPCHVPLHAPTLTLWWLALPLLAVTALVFTVRRRRPFAVTALPLGCAASVAVPYLFLLNYSAPRFFLPTYALLAPPLAALATSALRNARPGPDRPTCSRRRRFATATAVGVLLLAHLGCQAGVLTQTTAQSSALSRTYRQAADRLRQLGIHPPCLVSGPHAQPVGYDAGCASGDIQGNNRSLTPLQLRRQASRQPTAVLTDGHSPPPALARSWPKHLLPGHGHWVAYIWVPPPWAVRATQP